MDPKGGQRLNTIFVLVNIIAMPVLSSTSFTVLYPFSGLLLRYNVTVHYSIVLKGSLNVFTFKSSSGLFTVGHFYVTLLGYRSSPPLVCPLRLKERVVTLFEVSKEPSDSFGDDGEIRSLKGVRVSEVSRN